MRIGAILLAAGEAKRFGSNKLLAEINGVPLIRLSLRAYEELERVIIVGMEAEKMIPILREEIVIYNPEFKRGMSTSLQLGIRYFSDYDGVVVGLGDMPLVTRDDVNNVVQGLKQNCLIVIPTYRGSRGNPVGLRRALFGEVMKIKGDMGAREIIRNFKEGICYVEGSHGTVFDVDFTSDLERASQKLT